MLAELSLRWIWFQLSIILELVKLEIFITMVLEIIYFVS